MWVYVYVSICVYTLMYSLYVYISVYAYMCVFMYMCVCLCSLATWCLYMGVSICGCVRSRACPYVLVWVCVVWQCVCLRVCRTSVVRYKELFCKRCFGGKAAVQSVNLRGFALLSSGFRCWVFPLKVEVWLALCSEALNSFPMISRLSCMAGSL